MKNFYKFFKSFLFISLWLILSDFLIQKYWNLLHLEYIDYNLKLIFYKEYWVVLQKFLFGFDIGYWLEYYTEFITYEIPEESFKYIPIYFVLKSIWIKN